MGHNLVVKTKQWDCHACQKMNFIVARCHGYITTRSLGGTVVYELSCLFVCNMLVASCKVGLCWISNNCAPIVNAANLWQVGCSLNGAIVKEKIIWHDCATDVMTTRLRTLKWYERYNNCRLVVEATRDRQFCGMSQNSWMVLQWRTGWYSDTNAAWWLQVVRWDGVKDVAMAHQLSERQLFNVFEMSNNGSVANRNV